MTFRTILRTFTALLAMELRRALRRERRKPGAAESQHLTHRDAEHIRRHTHVPEDHKR